MRRRGRRRKSIWRNWTAQPSNAAMVAFGAMAVNGGRVTVQGFLYDTHNTQNPQVLGKQYADKVSVENTRQIAHRFADEIIERLGGIPGIAETKIYYVSRTAAADKEIWVMDYDGMNERQLTHLGTVSLSPHVSPDNSRVAFSSLGKNGWSIRMYSLDLGRLMAFPAWGETTLSPAWSSDGTQAGVFFGAQRRPGDLRMRRTGGTGARRRDGISRPGCFAGVESEDERADCVGERPNQAAADLHHGFRRGERHADDGRRIRDVAVVVAERAVSGVCVEPQLRAGSAGRRRHLYDGYCEQAVDAADARFRGERCSVLVAGQPAHCFPAGAGGHTEIWMMLADGTDQQQLTHGGAATRCPTGVGNES